MIIFTFLIFIFLKNEAYKAKNQTCKKLKIFQTKEVENLIIYILAKIEAIMKKVTLTLLGFLFSSSLTFAQDNNDTYVPRTTNFWSDVQIGGGLGLGFGSGFTNISVAPSAIKPVTEQLFLGGGLQFNYLKSKGFYESTSYGFNLIGIYAPAPMIQLSAEVEQLRVNNTWTDTYNNIDYKDNFWNTALFVGAGYTQGNATIGVRYNVLYKENNLVYSQAWMPFIRVYF